MRAMSTDTESEEFSTAPEGKRTFSDSSSRQVAYTRDGDSLAVLFSLGGLLLIWMIFVSGSKRATSPGPLGVLLVVGGHALQPKDSAGPWHLPPAPVLPPRPQVPWYESQGGHRPTGRVFTITRPLAPTVGQRPTTDVAEDHVPPVRTDFPEKLPGTLTPIHYDVLFKVILDANQEQTLMHGDAYYLSKTIILLQWLLPTHATGFTVKEQQTTLVKEADKTFVGIGKMSVNDSLEMLKIELETTLELHEMYSLSLETAGWIHNAPRGLYKYFFHVIGRRISVIGTESSRRTPGEFSRA